MSDLLAMLSTELVPLYQYIEVITHISIKVRRWLKGCIPVVLGPKTNRNKYCDTRSFSNLDASQHPNRAFPERDSFLNNDQFDILHSILSVVGVFGTPCIVLISVLTCNDNEVTLRCHVHVSRTIHRFITATTILGLILLVLSKGPGARMIIRHLRPILL